jgi:hypothetical protein
MRTDNLTHEPSKSLVCLFRQEAQDSCSSKNLTVPDLFGLRYCLAFYKSQQLAMDKVTPFSERMTGEQPKNMIVLSTEFYPLKEVKEKQCF